MLGVKRGLSLLGISLSVVLNGCSPLPNDKICTKVAALEIGPSATPPTVEERATNCVHRWAYRLARSPDNARDAADAVIGACRDAIAPLAFSQYSAIGNEKFDSELSGRSLDIRAQTYEKMRAVALFRVVQARAGHCALP